MFDNLMKLLYILLGFIYAVALYSFLPQLFEFFNQSNYEITPSFPLQNLFYFLFHLAIPAFIVSLIDKVVTLLQWEEDNSIVGLLMESLSFSIPAMFRGLMWGVAIAVANLFASYAADINILADVLDSWPFPL